MKIISMAYGCKTVGGKMSKVKEAKISITKSDWIRIGQQGGWIRESTEFSYMDNSEIVDQTSIPGLGERIVPDPPSLETIWRGQNKSFGLEDKAETMLEDFIFKALNVGYTKDEIVKGLEEFYRQHPSSGEGIYERAVAKLSGIASPLDQDSYEKRYDRWSKE